MKGEAFVSVVIPALDAGAVIRNSVASVLGQSHTNLEIVVVDNGSSDETCDIVRELSRVDSRVRLVDSGRTGVSHARNVGIDEARGEYIAFCDADDLMEARAVESLLAYAKHADVVSGAVSFEAIDEEGRVLSSSVKGVDEPVRAQGEGLRSVFEDLWERNCLQGCWAKLYSLDFINESGVRFDERLSSYEDLSFVLDCLSHGASFSAIPDVCYRYFRSTSETNSTRYKVDMTDQMERVSGRVVSFYEEVLGKSGDVSCVEHVIQLLVVAINNAQMTPGGLKTVEESISDIFKRKVFSHAASRATSYPNRYSRLLVYLGVHRHYRAVALIAAARNAIRGKYVAK